VNQYFEYAHPEAQTARGIQRLLPAQQELVGNARDGIITQVNDRCRFLEQAIFTAEEFVVIWQLVTAWPAAVSYIELLSVLEGVDLRDEAERLSNARQRNALQQVLEPIFEVIRDCEERLRLFDLEAVPVRDFGYKVHRSGTTRHSP